VSEFSEFRFSYPLISSANHQYFDESHAFVHETKIIAAISGAKYHFYTGHPTSIYPLNNGCLNRPIGQLAQHKRIAVDEMIFS
jgi:hypothetical protein